jgi:hypothetical protein
MVRIQMRRDDKFLYSTGFANLVQGNFGRLAENVMFLANGSSIAEIISSIRK